jgi:hypothetical protein
MNIATDLYIDQAARWPRDGRHILAHHDAETVIVYQAYRLSIGAHAIQHGVFGGVRGGAAWRASAERGGAAEDAGGTSVCSRRRRDCEKIDA